MVDSSGRPRLCAGKRERDEGISTEHSWARADETELTDGTPLRHLSRHSRTGEIFFYWSKIAPGRKREKENDAYRRRGKKWECTVTEREE